MIRSPYAPYLIPFFPHIMAILSHIIPMLLKGDYNFASQSVVIMVIGLALLT